MKRSDWNYFVEGLCWNDLIFYPRDRATIIGYWRGFIAKGANEFYPTLNENFPFARAFSNFILSFYQIRHMTWDLQVDTYAFKNKLSWIEAFDFLFQEFGKIIKWENDLAIFPDSVKGKELDTIDWEEVIFTDTIPKYTTINGQLIQKGTLIKLSKKITTEDLKKTIYFDLLQKDPSWKLFDIHESSYDFVRLFHLKGSSEWDDIMVSDKNIVSNKVMYLFELFTSEIKFIAQRNSKTYAYTNHFEIEIEPAFYNNEVEIVTEKTKSDGMLDKYFQETFQESINLFFCRFITKKELISRCSDIIYCHDLSFFGEKYAAYINHYNTFSGWYKKNSKT